MLEIASPYMLRNDGKLIKYDVMHPYIKYIPQNDNKIEIENLFNKNINNIIWFYNNCKSDETKKNIIIFVYSILNSNKYYNINSSSIETITYNNIPKKYEDEFTSNIKDIESLFLVLNDQLNQEFLRIRTSSKLFGGKSHAIYFRISSTDFNWFNLIWKLCYENKNWISDVTISLDPQSRESNAILNHNGIKIDRLPIDDFINLSENPIFEDTNNIDNIRKQLREGKALFEIFTTHPYNIHNCFNTLMEKYIKENFESMQLQLNNYLKEFIKENLEDIQIGNFLDIYRKFDLTHNYDCFQCSKFTQAMYNAGIDPLKYTNGVIPECFLFENQEIINDNLIPKNCTSIWEQAFSGCLLKEVIIPSTCLDIREYAFGSASITKLMLDCSSNCNIWLLAFENTSIYDMYLNHFPTNTNFISQVDNIKNLYLPTDDMDLIANWVRNHNKNYSFRTDRHIQNKVNNIISNVTGEVLDIDSI